MITTRQNGGNKIFPLVFVIFAKENFCNWFWFLCCLRHYVTKKQVICLISDRHPGIIKAIECSEGDWEPPKAYHCFYLHQLISDFNTSYENKVLKDLIHDAGIIIIFIFPF